VPDFSTPAEQVSKVLHLSMSPRGDSVTVQLEPEHLGKVQVVLIREAQGLVANFRVETPAAHGALIAEASELRRGLEAQGIQLVRVSVELESQTPDRREAREGRRTFRRAAATISRVGGTLPEQRNAWRISGFETTA
jgi:flagellar hook-length control protein FliK